VLIHHHACLFALQDQILAGRWLEGLTVTTSSSSVTIVGAATTEFSAIVVGPPVLATALERPIAAGALKCPIAAAGSRAETTTHHVRTGVLGSRVV